MGFFYDNQAAMPGASQLTLWPGAEQESYQKNHNGFSTSSIKNNISCMDKTKKKKSQKVGNNRMLFLKYFCSHLCHSPHRSLYHIAYACPCTTFSVFVTEFEMRSSLSKENQCHNASV